MKKKVWIILMVVTTIASSTQAQSLRFEKANTQTTGIFDDAGTRNIAFSKFKRRLFSTNASTLEIELYGYQDIFKPYLIKSMDVSSTLTKLHSLDAYNDLAVVTGDGNSPQLSGKILFYDDQGNYLLQLSTGPSPRHVRFTPDGSKVIVSNEGIPDSSYSTDPLGSVSIINLSVGLQNLTQANVKVVTFERLDTVAYDPMIRVYGNNGMQAPSRDIEPGAIAINNSSTKAYISLQENNAIAIIDLFSGSLDTVVGIGYLDHSATGIDASDVAQNINIGTYGRLFGMHQPGGMAFISGNDSYLVTANTGAAREYNGYNEVIRVKNQPVDPGDFNLTNNLTDSLLGRLKITQALGDMTGNLLHDSLFSFGSRSISVIDSSGMEIWNSGDQIEQTLATMHAANFNSTADSNNSYKNRSDDMGAEPEAVAVGEVDGVQYAFVALKKMGGIMIYNLSDPTSPQFEMYELNRNFSAMANSPAAGDLGPSSLRFVPASQTAEGIATLYIANEVSGTISVYQAGQGIGIEELEPDESLYFYPNPSEGVFYTGQKGDYKVYNATGQLVKNIANRNRVDLSGEADGYYLIQNENGTHLRIVKK
ncbi:MAG: choice-of-anchor I family protein [Owenweeksia sp.]|nr:choice-of-anchor I family protein [Owenweeksia sp.]